MAIQLPQLSAHVYCGQTAGWIKMPLGKEVGLGQGDFVLDGTQLPLQNEVQPQFSANGHCGQTVARLSYCRAHIATEIIGYDRLKFS